MLHLDNCAIIGYMAHPPSKYQATFWSAKVSDLDLVKDKAYIINQALAYGDLDILRWLFRTYDKQTIRDVFLKQPIKTYRPVTFNFVKNILLDIEQNLPKEHYVINTPRTLG